MEKTIIKKVKKVLPRVLIILGGIILVLIILFGGIKTNDYLQVRKLVKASDSLANQEKYQEAYNSLTLAQARWTTLKVKKQIETKLVLEKQLITDAENYTIGNNFFGQSKWQEAKDNYSKVSDKFPHYKEIQDKIKECQGKIDEANAQAEKDKQAEEQKAKAQRASTFKVTTTPIITPSAESTPVTTIPITTPSAESNPLQIQSDPQPSIEKCDNSKKQGEIYLENSYYQNLVDIENQRHSNTAGMWQKTLNDCLSTNPDPKVWCAQWQSSLNQENNYHDNQLVTLGSVHKSNLASINSTCY